MNIVMKNQDLFVVCAIIINFISIIIPRIMILSMNIKLKLELKIIVVN